MANVSKNSNVQFLLGTQADLAKYFTSAAEAKNGAFYLTQDTHRLYIGTSDGNVAAVNEGVTTVANLTALQAVAADGATNPSYVGNFYYVESDNILCVWNGKNWVQINNNANSQVKSFDSAFSAIADGVTVTTTLATKDISGRDEDEFEDTYNFKGVNLTISANGDDITFTGLKIVSFGAENDGDKTAKITLKDSGDNTADFKVIGGNNATVQKGTADNEIKIDVANMYNTSLAVSNAAKGFEISVTDGNGDVSGTFSPKISVISGVNDSDVVTSRAEKEFENGIAALDVYSKAVIDEKMKAINAMTYKGRAGFTSTDSTRNPYDLLWTKENVEKGGTFKIGDTYLFVDDGSFTPSNAGGKSTSIYKSGLAIARGTEDANGYITANTLVWDFVTTAGNTDTKFKLGVNNSSQIILQTDSGSDVTGTIAVSGGTAITAATSGSGSDATVTISHSDIERQDPAEQTGTQAIATFKSAHGTASNPTDVTVVESVTTNPQGHVTAVQTKKITLIDSNATLKNVSAELVTNTNKPNVVGVKTSVELTDGAGSDMGAKSATVEFASDSLTLSKADTGTTVNINLVWGSF